MIRSKLGFVCAVVGLSSVVAQSPSRCQTGGKPPTKGQGQTVGGNARFGETYTINGDWNFVIYRAKYSVEAYASGAFSPKPDEKVFILDFAIKNVRSTNNYLNTNNGWFTLVDSTGQLYNANDFEQDSMGVKGYDGNLKPGQGIGQPALHDALHAAAKIPAKARIVKIIVNRRRIYAKPAEEVFRYYIAGATKAEAGADGDPKNIVAPLPANVADPTDKSGTVALAEGKGTIGEYLPSQFFSIKLNSAAFSTDSLRGQAPRSGMKYVILKITARLDIADRRSTFDVAGGDFPEWQLTDSDGERYRPSDYLKASTDTDADHAFEKGDEYSMRVVFTVPMAATIKKVVIGCGGGRKWAFDGSVIQ